MITAERIKDCLRLLRGAYWEANPQDEFGDNFISFSVTIHSDGSGRFEANFYYSGDVDLKHFKSLDDLEDELQYIENGTSYMLGYEFFDEQEE